MARKVRTGKDVLDLLFDSPALECTASKKTAAEEREDLAEQGKNIEKHNPIGYGYEDDRYRDVIKTSAPNITRDDRGHIGREAGKALKNYIEARVGRGGLVLTQTAFEILASHDDFADPAVVDIDNALVAFDAEFATGGGTKQLYACVEYNADATDQYKVQETFYTPTKEPVTASSDALGDYLSLKEVKAEKQTSLVYYNTAAGAPYYEEIPVTNVHEARAKLEAEGFEVVASYLDKTSPGWEGPNGTVYEVVALPSQYEKLFKIARYFSPGLSKAFEEQDFEERSHQKSAEEPGYHNESQKMKQEWVDRASEKNPVGGRDDSLVSSEEDKDWPDRSLEKVDAPDAAVMLRYEQRKEAQFGEMGDDNGDNGNNGDNDDEKKEDMNGDAEEAEKGLPEGLKKVIEEHEEVGEEEKAEHASILEAIDMVLEKHNLADEDLSRELFEEVVKAEELEEEKEENGENGDEEKPDMDMDIMPEKEDDMGMDMDMGPEKEDMGMGLKPEEVVLLAERDDDDEKKEEEKKEDNPENPGY